MVDKVTKWLYLEPLLFCDDWVHLSEISKRLGKNHSVVRQYLGEFEKQGFVKKLQRGRMSMYRINLDSPFIVDVFVLVEKERLLSRGKDLIVKEVVGFLHGNFEKSDVIIFGSFVDNPRKANDVDILVVGNSKVKFNGLGKNINKKVHLVSVKDLGKISDVLREEIRKGHLIVQGSEKVVRWLI